MTDQKTWDMIFGALILTVGLTAPAWIEPAAAWLRAVLL